MVRLGVGECKDCSLKVVSNKELNEYSCSLGDEDDKPIVVFRSIGKNKVKWHYEKNCVMKYMIV